MGILLAVLKLQWLLELLAVPLKYIQQQKPTFAILGVESANGVGIICAAGLAQNLGALRALATSGIQAGHMKLHSRNMAVSAGAVGEEIELVAARLQAHNGPKLRQL